MKIRGPMCRTPFVQRVDGVRSDVLIGEVPAQDVADKVYNCLVQYDCVGPTTMAIWMDGHYSLSMGNVPAFPLRIEWRLFRGVGNCMADQEIGRAHV